MMHWLGQVGRHVSRGTCSHAAEILFANDPLWHDATRRTFDPRTLAWVDIDKRLEVSPFLSGEAPKPTGSVKVTPRRRNSSSSMHRCNRPAWSSSLTSFIPAGS